MATDRRKTGKHPNSTKRSKKRISRPKTNINAQKAKNKQHEPTGKDVTIRQSDATWRCVYGRARIGAIMTFAHDTGTLQHLVCTLACHKISAITALYLNEVKINFGASPDPRWAVSGTKADGTVDANYLNKVFMALNDGDENQAAQSDLVTQSAASFPGKWTAAHRQRGLAHAYIILIFNNKTFPDGLPDISFEVQGKSDIFDPRDSTYKYTNNAALIMADYLMNTKFGCSVPPARVDMDRLSAAANECDEDVALINGGTEKRYTVDFTFDTDETKQSVLEKMVTGHGGSLTYVNGLWKVWPARYHSPTVTLTDADLRSAIKIKTRASRRDNFNAVRGTYTSPTNKWQVTDFPIVKNNFYQNQDNGERNFEEMKYPVTLSPSACQRLSKIALEEVRQPIEVNATWGLRAFALEAPNVVLLTLARYGWTNKPFKVVETELILDEGNDSPELKVDMQLRETAEAVYDWNSGQETTVDLSPNSDLSSPFSVPPLTGLTLLSGTDQLYVRGDGTVFSRIRVEWDSFTNVFINSNGFVDIQYKKTADSEWNPGTPVIAEVNFTHILDVQDLVLYDVRARARNALSFVGEWATVTDHSVLGKSEPPSDVTSFGASFGSFGIHFTWDNILDLDLDHYELRLSDSTLEWDSAEFVAEVAGVQYTLALKVTDTYYFLIKSMDSSGNYCDNASSVVVAVLRPSAPIIQHTIVGENVVLKWTESIGQFAVADYEIRYGTSFDQSVFITKVKGTTYTLKGAWSGNRRFWIAAHDVAFNTGDSNFRDVTIYPPFAVATFTAQVIDNNVLLRWTPSTGGTLPVDYYNIYKGPQLASAELIGNTAGTFAAYFEIISGDFVYWCVPVDKASNVGQPASLGVHVDEPPDFELFEDVVLDPELALTLNNIRIEFIQGQPVIIPEPPLPGTSSAGLLTGLVGPLTYSA